jgi:hypothetical protein
LCGFDIYECTPEDPVLSELLYQADCEFNKRYPESGGQRRGPLLPGIRFIVVRHGNVAVGCCALQKGGEFSANGAYEVKRLFVIPEARSTGAVNVLMRAIESLAVSIDAKLLLFETGTRQPESISVAVRHGYRLIPPYPPYLDDPFAQCFAKKIADG